jgi:hypothetical protein
VRISICKLKKENLLHIFNSNNGNNDDYSINNNNNTNNNNLRLKVPSSETFPSKNFLKEQFRTFVKKNADDMVVLEIIFRLTS